MTNQNSRIDIRISSKEKELIFTYCKKNKIKVSNFLRNCVLNTIKEYENKEEEK